MCGICGTVGYGDRETVERMVAVIAHRGPDDTGVYVDAGVTLGNTRLKIIDLSAAGHMPMATPDGRFVMTYNGEIYNYLELRAELEARGVRFRSRTDTEVLLHLLALDGIGCLKRLNGMFAFALWDRDARRLLVARDRFGVKPLYYGLVPGGLVFGSEVKCLLASGAISASASVSQIPFFLTHLWVPGPVTMFEGVRKLPPGHYLSWQNGASAEAAYWELRFEPQERGTQAERAEELRAVLQGAVRRQLVSDRPVGVLLSGGVDSSALLALATREAGKGFHAYSIGFRPQDARHEQSGDDLRYSRVVAERCGATLHEITAEPMHAGLLERVIWHLDEPVADPAAIMTLLICEAARAESTVLLSGQGADEVFAGYRSHYAMRLAGYLLPLPGPVRAGLRAAADAAPSVRNVLPVVSPGFALAIQRFGRRLFDGLELPPERRYLRYRAHAEPDTIRGLYSDALKSEIGAVDPGGRHLAHFAASGGADLLNRLLYVDIKTFLVELNLTYCDKLSMAASIETRVPYLDNEVADFMGRVPIADKVSADLRTKVLLRAAVRPLIPGGVLRRRKTGFGAPIRSWLRGELSELMGDLLSEESVRRRGFFDPRAVSTLRDQHVRGTRDHSYLVWALLTFETWMRVFVDGGWDRARATHMGQVRPEPEGSVARVPR